MLGWFRSLFGRFALQRLPARRDPGKAAVQIVFSAPVTVYDVSAPGFTWNGSPAPPEIEDADRLRKVQDAECEDLFCDPLADDSSMAGLVEVLSGGQLTFTYDSEMNRVCFDISFGATRRLTENEVAELREYVYGQLLDGIGEGFQQAYAGGRTYAESARGLGSRMWLAFNELEHDQLEMKVTG